MKKLSLAVMVSSVLLGGCATDNSANLITTGNSAPQVQNVLAERAGIQRGQLANGMNYIVAENEQSGERVSLQLIVHAGSLDEDDDQQGIAHLVEHMAFNGTKDFPANEIIEHQESLGMVFGRDVNAMTEYNTTSYFLHLPNNSEQMLDEAFHMLSQQAFAIEFNNEELEKERPVVEEEWRSGRHMMARLGQENRKILLAGSRHGEREPIGDMELVRHVDASRIKAFWETWYHPNNMTLVVVGKTNKAAVEAKLNHYFAPIPSAELPQRSSTKVPLSKQLKLAVIEDPEITTEVVSVSFRGEQASPNTLGTLQQELLNDLAMAMFTKRMTESYQVESDYISRMVAASQPLATGYNNNRIIAILQDRHYRQAYSELFANVSAFKAHGFSEADLAVAKANIVQRYRQMAEAQQNSSNSRLLMALFSQLRTHEPLVDPNAKFVATQQLINQFSLTQVNQYFSNMLSSRAPVAIVQVNPEHAELLPTESEVTQLWQHALANPPAVDNQNKAQKSLFDKVPEPARYTSYQQHGDTHVWTFANGASVWFVPSDETENQLMLKWQGNGGTEHLAKTEQRAAQLSAQNLGLFGYGGLTATEMSAANAGNQMRQSAFITQDEHIIFGSTDMHSLETWMQNLNKRITAPQIDDTIWASRQLIIERGIDNRNVSPDGIFNQAIDNIRYKDNPMTLQLTKEELKHISSQDMLNAWKKIFTGAADHQLVVVGDAKPEQVIDMAARYIGHLPAGESYTEIVLPKVTEGHHQVRIEAGSEPVALTSVLFNVPMPFSDDANNKAGLVSRIISTRLREQLREASGGVYSLRFGIRLERERQQASGMLSYSHQPGRGDELKLQADEVIAKALAEGITPQELTQIKQQHKSALAPEMITDRQRLTWLTDNAKYNKFESKRDAYLDWLDQVTVAELNAFAKAVLEKPNTIDARLLPETI
ncbi:M16 family metallopeptidase [Shewanella fidelis]|uniref:M16 family metallopeptidase n=1 Tax=Shewanella fidelis TaxID=173509 RepID=UPI000490AFD5|nr:M16 family metallopeptidase [Shewanella fidelis]